MSLNIKNPETVRLARELARETGESLTTAVTESVRERLQRVRPDDKPGLADRLLRIGADCAERLPDEVRDVDHGELLYDADGLPQVIIDTSALIAILRAEPDAASFANAIADAQVRRISAANYVELGAVIDRARDPVASRRVDQLLEAANISIQPVTVEQASIARQAYRDFGKGSGHRAALNYGDCFAYALAKAHGEPLLFKGDNFAETDLERA